MTDLQPKPTIAELKRRTNDSLEKLQTLIDTYTDEQMTTPTDATGWTVRDHLMHLVVWAEGIAALLNSENRWAVMGISDDIAKSRDYDAINDVIFKQHKEVSLNKARAKLIEAHTHVLSALDTLGDDDLLVPYERHMGIGDGGHPLVAYVMGSVGGHYEEHMPWIEAIVAGNDMQE